MVNWQLVYTTQAMKDAKKISSAGLRPKAETLLDILKRNPFQNLPPYEKLIGDLAVACSLRGLPLKLEIILSYCTKRYVSPDASCPPTFLEKFQPTPHMDRKRKGGEE